MSEVSLIAQQKWTPYPFENKDNVERVTQGIIAGLSQFAKSNLGSHEANSTVEKRAYNDSEFQSHLARDFLEKPENIPALVKLFKPQEIVASINEFPKAAKLGCVGDGCATKFVTRFETREISVDDLVVNYLQNELRTSNLSEAQKGKAYSVISSVVNSCCQQGRQ